jgi:predicted transcriptional regulator
MKTAISIDDDLLQQADEAAQSMGLSRSRLFAQAVGDFLKRNREEQMLRQLNEAYRGETAPNEKQLLKSIKAKVLPVMKDRW